MKRTAGFTVVEILITLTIMAILLTLAVVSMKGVQANGRDSERQADVEAIARGLESYYSQGNPRWIVETKGAYPSTTIMGHILGSNLCSDATASPKIQTGKCDSTPDGYAAQALPGVSEAALRLSSWDPTGPRTFMVSGTLTDADIQAKVDAGYYVYKPMQRGSTTSCTDETCARFIITYKKETTGEVITVKSEHQ